MKMIYEIYEPNFKVLSSKLARYRAKLEKVGLATFSWTATGHQDRPHPTKPSLLVRYITVEVESTFPAANGWTFIAVLLHTDEGNIIRALPGYTVPPEFRDRATWCDHCRCSRQRRDTYVVRHEDGRVMQVGSSCLVDFVGVPNARGLGRLSEMLLNALDTCEAAQRTEWLGGGGSALETYRIDLDTYLQHVAAVVLQTGRYVTKKVARESREAAERGDGKILEATSDVALHEMSYGQLQRLQGGHVYAVTPEAQKLATDARQWVLNRFSPAILDPDGMSSDDIYRMLVDSRSVNQSLSDFEHNLLSCARLDAIEPRLAGIAAYIIEAFRRSQPRPEAAQLNTVGLSHIFKMFEKAKAKLKHPAIRLANEQGQRLHLSLAGVASKNAGFVYVKAANGFDSAYYGKISPEGRFFKVGTCPEAVEPLLQSFASDPEDIATKYGRLTGCCSFCGRKLSDARSTEVGYGPVCADKFGLDWGIRKDSVEAEQPEAEQKAA